jgi:hypothetical protein
VAEVVLQRAGVDAIVGELEAAAMAQHVRMSPRSRIAFGAEERNSPRVGLWTLKAPPVPRRGFLEQLRPNEGSEGSRA